MLANRPGTGGQCQWGWRVLCGMAPGTYQEELQLDRQKVVMAWTDAVEIQAEGWPWEYGWDPASEISSGRMWGLKETVFRVNLVGSALSNWLVSKQVRKTKGLSFNSGHWHLGLLSAYFTVECHVLNCMCHQVFNFRNTPSNASITPPPLAFILWRQGRKERSIGRWVGGWIG